MNIVAVPTDTFAKLPLGCHTPTLLVDDSSGLRRYYSRTFLVGHLDCQRLDSQVARQHLAGQVSRSIQRLEPYSDEKAPTLKTLRRKARAIGRAMNCVVWKRLIPGITPELPPGPEDAEQ